MQGRIQQAAAELSHLLGAVGGRQQLQITVPGARQRIAAAARCVHRSSQRPRVLRQRAHIAHAIVADCHDQAQGKTSKHVLDMVPAGGGAEQGGRSAECPGPTGGLGRGFRAWSSRLPASTSSTWCVVPGEGHEGAPGDDRHRTEAEMVAPSLHPPIVLQPSNANEDRAQQWQQGGQEAQRLGRSVEAAQLAQQPEGEVAQAGGAPGGVACTGGGGAAAAARG